MRECHAWLWEPYYYEKAHLTEVTTIRYGVLRDFNQMTGRFLETLPTNELEKILETLPTEFADLVRRTEAMFIDAQQKVDMQEEQGGARSNISKAMVPFYIGAPEDPGWADPVTASTLKLMIPPVPSQHGGSVNANSTDLIYRKPHMF